MPIIKIKRFIIIVNFRQVRVGKKISQHPPLRAHFGYNFTVRFASPATVPFLLIFPLFGIADTRFCFHIVEPCIFNAFPGGPDIFTGYGAGVAADTFIEIQHHPNLCAYSHSAASNLLTSGPSSQSTLSIFLTITNSSRLEPTVP